MKKKILLITQVFYPDQVSTANLFTNLVDSLKNERGIDVDVWCAQPSYSSFERQPKKVKYKNINISYLPSTNYPKESFLGRLLNYLTFTLSVCWKLFFASEKNVVLTHTTPPSLGIFLSFICRLKKRDFIYVLLDIFPDGLVRLGKLREKSLIVRIWSKLSLLALQRCTKIIVIGRDMKDWLIDFYPKSVHKVTYIPLWQDSKLIKPIDFILNPFVLKYNLQNKFVVQYSGNMGLWNDMETFGKAVNSKLDNVVFTFIGGGMRKHELINTFNEPNPENALLIPFLSNEEYSYSVSGCHVALISLQEGLEGIAVPSKIIGIMAAGVPIIAVVPEESEIAKIIAEEENGIVIKPGDIESLLETILMFKSNPILCQQMGLKGRYAFEKKYTTSIISEKYALIIE